jgi:hypothetical protein
VVGPFPSPEELRQYEAAAYEVRNLRRRSVRIEAILRFYVLIGVFGALCALAYFGFSFLDIEITDSQRFALLTAGTSISVALISSILLFVRRQQEFVKSDENYSLRLTSKLIREWAVFENLGRNFLVSRGETFNRSSPRAIVSALANEGLLSEGTIKQLHLALEIRNKLVHSVEMVPIDVIRSSIEVLQEINEVLGENKKSDNGNVRSGVVDF